MSTRDQKEILLKNIANIIESPDGTIFKLSIEIENNRILLILSHEENIVSVLLLFNLPGILYIDRVDSTGIYKSITKSLVKAVISAISPHFIALFSRPTASYIFGGVPHSSKTILTHKSLMDYWIDILEASSIPGKVHVWSNSVDAPSHPYQSKEDFVTFNDDPKRKVADIIGKCNVDEIFTALLCRRDFVDGALIYWISHRVGCIECGKLPKGWKDDVKRLLSEDNLASEEIICNTCSNISVDDVGETEYHKENAASLNNDFPKPPFSTTIENTEMNDISLGFKFPDGDQILDKSNDVEYSIDRMLEFLGSSDFSNPNKILDSSRKFFSVFKLQSVTFKFLLKQKERKNSEDIVCLKIKSKRLR